MSKYGGISAEDVTFTGCDTDSWSIKTDVEIMRLKKVLLPFW
jgi:hypothetical protein